MTNFWEGKRVFVTGHTGFKGSWLCLYLKALGAEVIGYALPPATRRDNYVLCGVDTKINSIIGDIRDKEGLERAFKEAAPEAVFHLAAQPIVRESYKDPRGTWETNVIGTLNLLENVRASETVKAAVIITTDKCYENKEQLWGYRETDPLGGYDPYSSSKAAAEILTASYRRSFFEGKAIATARAGNVIGGGDWAVDRIVPDCIRAIEGGREIEIRSPKSIRPWQHVLEPLSGYIMLAERLCEEPERFACAWNFGPEQSGIVTVWELAEKLIQKYGAGVLRDISGGKQLHEAELLALDISKARYELGWQPKLGLDETLDWVAQWYRGYSENSAYTVCMKQIEKYRKRCSR